MREGGKVWVPLPFFIMMPSLQFRSSPKRERDRVQPSSRSVCIKHSVCTVQWPWKTRFALPDRSKSCLPAVCLPSAFRALAAQPAEDLDEQVLQTASNGPKRSSSASSLRPSLPPPGHGRPRPRHRQRRRKQFRSAPFVGIDPFKYSRDHK